MIALPSLFIPKTRLENEPQRHLDLPWAADGFVDGTQGTRTVIETRGRILSGATGWQWRSSSHGKLVVELILRDVVDGDIETGRIGHVENIEAVLQREAFRDRVTLANDTLTALCQDWRKMLRWPLVKLVSKVSLAGIAPPRAPGCSIGKVKQLGLSAVWLGLK